MLFTNKCSAVAVVGDRLATIDMGRKLGGLLCPLFRGGVWEELGPHLSQCGLYQMESWSIQPFGHNTPTLQTDRTDRHDRTTVR